MKDQAFQEFKEKILEIDPFLEPAENEKQINQIFHKLQSQLELQDSLLDVANLFITALNSSNSEKADTENAKLPNGLDLTSLKIDPSGKNFTGFINQISSITDKIVDPKTRELILMPLLMQNFSKPFNVSKQMLELIDGLRCADDSKPKLDADSISKTSAKFINYLQHFQAPSISPNAKPMGLIEMYGILQTVSNFQAFGFALKQPRQIGACTKNHYDAFINQAPRFGLYEIENQNYLADWFKGNIRLTASGIAKPYTIMHEIFHMFLPNEKYSSFGLNHIDSFNFFKPLLSQKNFIPITILNSFYPCAIPTNYTKNEEIGVIDLLLTASARNAGRAYNISENCNQIFQNPSEFFKQFCPNNEPPRLVMDTPYNQNLYVQQLANNSANYKEIFNDNLLKTLQAECLTAIWVKILQIAYIFFKLNEKNQNIVLSFSENASRIGFMGMFNCKNSKDNIAIFSGLITLAKTIDLIMPKLGIKSPQESSQKLVNNIAKSIIGEDGLEAIHKTIESTSPTVKNSINQFIFILSLYALDGIIKNSQNDDKEKQILKIKEKILIGFIASIFSPTIRAILDLGINKIFRNGRRNLPEEINVEEGISSSRLSSDLVNPSPIIHPINLLSQPQIALNNPDFSGRA